MKDWMIDENYKETHKETFYGSWEDYEKATGMSKAQYEAREKIAADELAELESLC